MEARDPHGMTHATLRTAQPPTAAAMPPPAHGPTLTRSQFAELAGELDRLRAAYRAELAERLRDARSA
jgi:hypothetical protein